MTTPSHSAVVMDEVTFMAVHTMAKSSQSAAYATGTVG